ncbi:MAG: helix-turn-helix domain-containing protein [Tannerella sp.]|nr:helix-turn-helix domain-containing protein [Tannerella sp.]
MINIDKLLKDKGLSKTDIARRMNLSRESLYRIISGNPTLENIQKLASALGVPITELFEQPKSDVINCPHCGGKIKMSKE